MNYPARKITSLPFASSIQLTDIVYIIRPNKDGTGGDYKLPAHLLVGKKGDNATIKIGKVVTGEEGTPATVTNVGTETNAILDFSIPKGDTPIRYIDQEIDDLHKESNEYTDNNIKKLDDKITEVLAEYVKYNEHGNINLTQNTTINVVVPEIDDPDHCTLIPILRADDEGNLIVGSPLEEVRIQSVSRPTIQVGYGPVEDVVVESDLIPYAKSDSPDLTGIPTSTTAPAGTNNKQIATTEFVQTAINNAIDAMLSSGSFLVTNV